MKNLLYILLIFIITSCALDRSNPLDPIENDIDVPNEVLGIDVSHSSSDQIDITWVTQSEVNGYYVYRCMSIDGYYDRIDDDKINSGDIDSFTDNNILPGQWYYYKMSAYIEIDGKRLEGYRSGPKTW